MSSRRTELSVTLIKAGTKISWLLTYTVGNAFKPRNPDVLWSIFPNYPIGECGCRGSFLTIWSELCRNAFILRCCSSQRQQPAWQSVCEACLISRRHLLRPSPAPLFRNSPTLLSIPFQPGRPRDTCLSSSFPFSYLLTWPFSTCSLILALGAYG